MFGVLLHVVFDLRKNRDCTLKQLKKRLQMKVCLEEM